MAENPGTTKYPGALDDFANVGTGTYEDDTGYAHGDLHNQVHGAIEAIQATLGTTAGTSVISGWAAGAVAVRKNNDTMGSPGITGGTIASASIRNPTIGTPAITGGTVTSPAMAGTITYTDNAPKINVRARAYLNAAQQNIADQTWTKVLLETEIYDVGADFGTANNCFIAPVSGYYDLVGQVRFEGVVADKRYVSAIYVNGASEVSPSAHASNTGGISVPVATKAYIPTGGTVELYAWTNGGTVVDINSGEANTFLCVDLIST